MTWELVLWGPSPGHTACPSSPLLPWGLPASNSPPVLPILEAGPVWLASQTVSLCLSQSPRVNVYLGCVLGVCGPTCPLKDFLLFLSG